MDNWKTVITFTYPHEAHMAKGYLESEGIETKIQDEMTAQVNNFYSNAIGGVKILIKDKDYEEGIKILTKGGYINEQNKEDDLKIETHYINSKAEKDKCPYCGSKNIEKAKKPNILSVIGVLILNAFFPIFRRYYHCFDCKKNWLFKIKK
jgi:DNA-directed RNA polymerase subunit RPC12/RpoP